MEKGFHYVINTSGQHVAVQIDLQEHGDLWEEFLAFRKQKQMQAKQKGDEKTDATSDKEQAILNKVRELNEKRKFQNIIKELESLIIEEEAKKESQK